MVTLMSYDLCPQIFFKKAAGGGSKICQGNTASLKGGKGGGDSNLLFGKGLLENCMQVMENWTNGFKTQLIARAWYRLYLS